MTSILTQVRVPFSYPHPGPAVVTWGRGGGHSPWRHHHRALTPNTANSWRDWPSLHWPPECWIFPSRIPTTKKNTPTNTKLDSQLVRAPNISCNLLRACGLADTTKLTGRLLIGTMNYFNFIDLRILEDGGIVRSHLFGLKMKFKMMFIGFVRHMLQLLKWGCILITPFLQLTCSLAK